MAMIYPFMQKLREAPFPAPGNTVEIKSFIPESGTEVRPNPPIPLLLRGAYLVFDDYIKSLSSFNFPQFTSTAAPKFIIT